MDEVKGSNFESEKDGGASSNRLTSDTHQKPISHQRSIAGPTRRSSKGHWTPEEDESLKIAVRIYNGKNWKRIAECLPDRTDVQCLHRWQKVLHPDLVKGPWTKEEDELIIQLVGKQGNKKWSEIAKSLPGRIGKQCRERWYNHLNPDINKNPWTREEEMVLAEAHKAFGNKWAEIAKFLHGRSENSIKNHWNCSMKKKLYYSPSVSVLSHPAFTSHDSLNHEIKQKFEAVKQKLGSTFSMDERMNSETIVDTSPKSVAENARKRDSHLLSFKYGNCRITRDGSYGSVVPPFIAPSRMETENDTTPHQTISNQPKALCNNSLSLYRNSHNPVELFNISPPRLSSEYFPPSVQSLDSIDSRLSNQIKSSESFRPTFGSGDKKDNDFGTHLGGLCYEPLQEEDLNLFVTTGKFPSTDSYIRLLSTPKTHKRDNCKSTDQYNSPEIILRSAAMSFENVPSIIRKRGLHTPEENNSPLKRQQLFFSPPKSQKLENSAAMEKRLELDFDSARDSDKYIIS